MLKAVVAFCLVGVVVCGPPVSRSRDEIERFRDYLEGTRTDRGVILPRSPTSQSANAWESSGKYQGDILLDDEQLESLVEQYSSGRNAYIWPNTLWPQNTVVYEFGAGQFNAAQRNHILYTMSVLEDRTCIRFRPRVNNEFNYVMITGHSDGCYANVGYWATRGVHVLNVQRDVPGHGCLNPIIVIHEWLHIIGFFHMQSTHDRDNYVRINWENIYRGMEYNFDRYETDIVSNLGLPYEYDSCMHYGPYAFSMNGRTTIDALRDHHGEMGQASYVTGIDFMRVDRLYNCAPWKKAVDYKPYHFEQSDVTV